MRTLQHLAVVTTLAAALLGACGKKDGEGAAGGTSGDTAAKKVEVSPEMTAFLASFSGKSSAVTSALTAHGAPDLDTKDMGMYDLASPTVTAHEKRADNDCYTFDAKAGMTTRTFETCWAGGKITEVADKGMR